MNILILEEVTAEISENLFGNFQDCSNYRIGLGIYLTLFTSQMKS